MTIRNRSLAAFTAAGLAILSLSACSSSSVVSATGSEECEASDSAPGVTDDTITVGTTLPLTGSAAATGIATKIGEDAYFEHLNAQGGIDGRKLEAVYLDDQYLPAKAQSNVRQLIQEEDVFLIVGGDGTGTTLSWAPTLNQFKVPGIAPYAGSSNLGTMETPYLYMTIPDYSAQMEVITKYAIEETGTKKIALVSVSGDALNDAKKGIENAIAGTSVTAEYFPETAGTTNFTPLATSVKATGADLVIMVMTNGDTAGFLNATKRLGYEPKLAAWPGMADTSWLEPYGDISEGMLVANPVANPDSEDPKVAEFRDQFKEITGKSPTLFNEIGWAQGMLTAKAIEDAEHLNRACVGAALQNLENYETGLMPPITFGEDTRQGTKAIEVDVIKNGKLVTVQPFSGSEG